MQWWGTGVPRHIADLCGALVATSMGVPTAVSSVLIRWCFEDPTGERSHAMAFLITEGGDPLDLAPELGPQVEAEWERIAALADEADRDLANEPDWPEPRWKLATYRQ